MWMHPHTNKLMETNSNTPEAKQPASAGCIPRLVVPLQIGDNLPLHKYSGQNIPLETLTLWFYHAHCQENQDEIEQLEMAIEEILKNNSNAFALFSIAYRVSQKVDERHGRHACQYTPEEAWERLDSTHRLLWQNHSEITQQDIEESMPPRLGWDL